MKLVKIFAALVLVVIILYFLLQNTNPVDVNLVFVQKEAVPVSVVMLGALSIGLRKKQCERLRNNSMSLPEMFITVLI